MRASSGRLSRIRLRVRLFRSVEQGLRSIHEAKGFAGMPADWSEKEDTLRDGLSESREEREKMLLAEQGESSRDRLRLRAIVAKGVDLLYSYQGENIYTELVCR